MRKQIAAALLLTFVGCSAAYNEQALSTDHPANPEASAAPPAPRSRVLTIDSAEPATDARSNAPGHADHGGMKEMSGMKHEHTEMSIHAEDHNTKPPSSQASFYVCPMHPEVTSDKPDQRCPKCGMKLVKKSSGGSVP